MAAYSNFIRTDLENGCVICDDVHFSSGTVCRIFLSACGVYVLSTGCTDPKTHYAQLIDTLNVPRIRLYLLGDKDALCGLYCFEDDSLGSEMDEQALTDDVNSWLSEGRILYDEAALDRIVARIRSADIKARGYWVDENGEVFILRHGRFLKASPKSSDRQYYLTLFMGTLGFHRFAMGKIISGLVYLFTGGFFLVGWLTDLVQLLVGAQKDRKKRYLFPLTDIKKKLLLLPLGLVIGLAIFFAQYLFSELFSLTIQNMIAFEVQNADPQQLQTTFDFLGNLFSQ